MWRWQHKMSYAWHMMSLHIARTTSHVRCTSRCRMLHVRCTSCTYDIVYTYDIVGGKNPDEPWTWTSTVSTVTAPRGKFRKLCVIASLKGLRLVHFFRALWRSWHKRFQGHRRRRQEEDGYSNNKRSSAGPSTFFFRAKGKCYFMIRLQINAMCRIWSRKSGMIHMIWADDYFSSESESVAWRKIFSMEKGKV